MHLPTLLTGGLFFVLGAVFGGSGVYLMRAGEERLLESEGRPARAELLRKSIHADRTTGAFVRPAYRVDYRFAPAQGEVVAAAADIDPDLWKRLGPCDPLEVVYLAAEPSVHRVEGAQRDRAVAIVFALIGLVFAPLGLWLMRGAFRASTPVDAAGRPGFGDRLGTWIARSPAFAFGIAGVVFFLPFAAAGVAWFAALRSEEALFAARAQSVQGMILGKAVVEKRSSVGNRPSQRTTHYHVTYRFRSDAGHEVIGTSEIGAEAWERLKEREPIAVRYVAGSPWLHRLGAEGGAWGGALAFLLVGGLGVLASAAAALWGWPRWSQAKGRSPKRQARTVAPPLAPPPPATAPPRQPSVWALAFGAVFFTAGCAALVNGALELGDERRYAAEGRIAEARITEKRMQAAERSAGARTQYIALYRFTTPEGEPGEGRALLEVSVWEAAKAGDSIRVRYLAASPQTNRAAAEGGFAGCLILMAVGIIFAAAGAGIAYAGWWLPRRGAA